MLFNSYEFLFVFLPIVIAIFFLLARWDRLGAAAWLSFSSLVFYGYWSPKYVPLLLGSVVFNFYVGRAIAVRAESGAGRALLILGVAANLLLLAFFKYCDFFVTAVNDAVGSHIALLGIVLPIGISFYTFTQIAFLADASRGLVREYRFVHYLLFVTYFPHLIAGPILHHSEMMPQFAAAAPYRLSTRSCSLGLTALSIGLAKKVLIADQFAAIVSPIFAAAHHGTQIRFAAAWLGAWAYAFQLYFDFSGYSDMAIGISKLFGIDLPVNFTSPYKATNIIEFWRRWHMTLSRFLRDYLYVPLGGNRHGTIRRYLNLMATMLLGGLWHGANYTFVIWGGLHGTFLAINHGWRAMRPAAAASGLWRDVGGTFVTMCCIVAAWVWFRADDVASAMNLSRGMLGFSGIAVHDSASQWSTWIARHFPSLPISSEGVFQHLPSMPPAKIVTLFFVAALLVWSTPNTAQIMARIETAWVESGYDTRLNRLIPVAYGLLFAAAVMMLQGAAPFLYFRF
jgi:alginate O-acetyltransferase complex protein AlgI